MTLSPWGGLQEEAGGPWAKSISLLFLMDDAGDLKGWFILISFLFTSNGIGQISFSSL